MNSSRPTILVTGANGFVGQHLSLLLEKEGWSVRRTIRRTLGSGAEVIRDIGPETDWAQALIGVDAVVHLAARVHHPHDEHNYALYRSLNVEGTLCLARSAAKAGVRQFIFISTALVYGRSSDGRAPLNEHDPVAPSGCYARSKVEAETRLKSFAEDSALNVTVVRPPMIFGPGAKGNFASLVKAVSIGMPLPFSAVCNRRAFLSIQNFISFISWRLSKLSRGFDVFVVADAEQVSTPEFIERLAKAAGRRAHLFPAPASLLSLSLRLVGRPEARNSLLGSLELNLAKANSAGWRPPLTLDEGLRLALGGPNC